MLLLHLYLLLPLQLRRNDLHKTNLGILGRIEPFGACGEAPGAPTEGALLASASCVPSSGENDGVVQHGSEPWLPLAVVGAAQVPEKSCLL